MFCAEDNSPLKDIKESNNDKLTLKDLLDKAQIDIRSLDIATKEQPAANLGIGFFNEQLYSGNYVGICRLKFKDNRGEKRNVVCDGKEVILKIEPRFGVPVPDMLSYVSGDDEFEHYLAKQTTGSNSDKFDAEDTINNALFCFSEDEDPVLVEDIAENSSINMRLYLKA